MSEKRKEMEDVLKELGRIGDVIGSAFVRRDGLLIVSVLPSEVDSRAVAAMTAAIVGTSETSAKELSIGDFYQVVVNATQGKYAAIGAGEEAILIALVRKESNLGLILLEMDKSAKKLAGLAKSL
ncbi:MAG TPA: roadblock/LC7 domain-containing protein [archaeon]|nr:roadblock/LC7 domain-containing protein [archaeon]